MRAARVTRRGAPDEVIRVEDVPVPEVGPGEVLVRVAAGSLNFGDIARCRGGVASVMAEPPFTLGMDACGVVESAGEGAEPWVGRRVVAMCKMSLGGLAEFAVAPSDGVFDAPPGLDDPEGAAYILPFHTTYLALHERAQLQAGETVLIVGAASAVGTAAIQVARAAGAPVIAVAGGPAKTDLCTRLGATTTVDHTGEDVFEKVMTATDGRGAEVVIDLVGGEGTEKIWTCVAYGGRYVPLGFNDDPQSGFTGRPLRKVAMGNLSVVGVVLAYAPASPMLRQFGIVPNPPEVGRRVHEALCALVEKGAILPYIGRRIGMAEVGSALMEHEQRLTMGRTVVDVAGGTNP